MSNRRRGKPQVNRLQNSQNPLPIPKERPNTSVTKGKNHRKRSRMADQYLSITVALWTERMRKSGKWPKRCNHWCDILNAQQWLKDEPNLFHLPEAEAEIALEWALDYRLSLVHNWKTRMITYSIEHLSAVIILARQTMMHDPITEKEAIETMNELHPGVPVLTSFPAVPPRPKY